MGFFQEDEDEDQNDQNEPKQIEAIIDMQGALLDTMELDLIEQDLNQQLLETALKLAKQDFWWIFRSHVKKMRRVERTYRRLINLVRDDFEKKEGK